MVFHPLMDTGLNRFPRDSGNRSDANDGAAPLFDIGDDLDTQLPATADIR